MCTARLTSNIAQISPSAPDPGENRRRILVWALVPAIFDGMHDIFACGKCHSIYEITRHRQQPLKRPHCQVCNAQFPPRELGDWLSYQRAEPEWRLAEWLGVKVRQHSVPLPRQAFIELAQRELQSADLVVPSTQVPPAAIVRLSDEGISRLPG